MAYCITSVITIAVGYYVMADYFVEVYPEAYLKMQVHYDRYVVPKGNGYFASVFPNYITNIDGVPVAAVVRVLLRHTDPFMDGTVVAQVKSAPDGTWLIDGLNTRFKYDVVARHDGYNDLIFANVSPLV